MKLTKSKSVFISRDLSLESPFFQQLFSAGFKVHAESLLTFTPTPFSKIPPTDWIFFYSKNGVTFFFKQLKEKNISIPSNTKFAAFGPATATAIQSNGVITSFIGSGKKFSTAKAFGQTAKNKKVLFVQAKNSQKSVQKIIQATIESKELVVYNNTIKQDIHIPTADLLVFTSPLNVQAYFDKYNHDSQQRIFAIGETTAKALHSLKIECEIASLPSEKELLKLILQ